jgi:hypothetical protein
MQPSGVFGAQLSVWACAEFASSQKQAPSPSADMVVASSGAVVQLPAANNTTSNSGHIRRACIEHHLAG